MFSEIKKEIIVKHFNVSALFPYQSHFLWESFWDKFNAFLISRYLKLFILQRKTIDISTIFYSFPLKWLYSANSLFYIYNGFYISLHTAVTRRIIKIHENFILSEKVK